MYLAYPLKLKFKLDPMKHTVALSQKFPDGCEMNLGDQIRACIANTEIEARTALVEAVTKEYAKLIVDNNRMHHIEIRDFILIYTVSKINDGRVMVGPNCGRQYIELL